MEYFFQLLVSGLAIGLLYATVAIGFVVIFRATGILNFAQGELILIGAYIFYTCNGMMHLPAPISFIITLIVCFFIGSIIERVILRPMLGEPVVSIVMITIGLSIFIRSMVGIIWSADNKALPGFFSPYPIEVSGVYLPPAYLYLGAVALVAIFAVAMFIQFSKYGLAMRATANDQYTAYLMGVNVKVIFGISWAISALLASIAGIFLGYITQISLHISHAALKLFPAVVVGGLDSALGAFVGGILIALIESFTGGYISGELKEIVPFIVLLLILMVKPYGLFGKEDVERV